MLIPEEIKSFSDVKAAMPRATEIAQVLYQIPDYFGNKVLHLFNYALFEKFYLDVLEIENVLKARHDIEWHNCVYKIKQNYHLAYQNYKTLNICIRELSKKVFYNAKYWEFIKKDQDYFKHC